MLSIRVHDGANDGRARLLPRVFWGEAAGGKANLRGAAGQSFFIM